MEFETEVAPESPEQFTIVSGDNQTVAPNSAVPLPFVVNLKDPNLNPVPNWGIVFRSETGGGHFTETAEIIQTYTGGEYGEGGLATDAFLAGPGEAEAVALSPCPGGGGAFLVSISQGHRILKVDENGVVRSVVGTGVRGFGGDGGPATSALINVPQGMTFDPAGNLYFCDASNQRVRRVDLATGIITTVAGSGTGTPFVPPAYSGDGGPATEARFANPTTLAFLPDGDLLIADASNRLVRRVDSVTGIVTRFAGGGTTVPSTTPIPALSARFTSASDGSLSAVTVDAEGVVYFATASRLCRVGTDGMLTLIAGTGVRGYGGDGGPALQAQFNLFQGLTLTPAGDALIVGDFSNHRVRRIDLASGIVTTIAGTGVAGFFGDGGPATLAGISGPRGVGFHCNGDLLVVDGNNNRVRRIDSSGTIQTIAGSDNVGDHGPLTAGRYGAVQGVAGDAAGNLYVVDQFRLRKIDRDGIVTTVAGTGAPGLSGDGGLATESPLLTVTGITVDGNGNVYFCEQTTLGFPPVARVRKVDAAGILTTVAGQAAAGFGGDGGPAVQALMNRPGDVTVDPAGNLYIWDALNGRVRKVAAATGTITTVLGGGAQAFADGLGATSVAVFIGTGLNHRVFADGSGSLYFSYFTGNSIWRVDAGGTLHHVAGVLGTAIGYSGDGGPATAARFADPQGLHVDAAGNVYVADSRNHAIRRIDAATGIITRVAGAAPTGPAPGSGTAGLSGDGGEAASALLSTPVDVWLDPLGNVHIADLGNLRLRRIASGTASSVLAVTEATGTATSPAYVTGPGGCQTVTATAPGVSVGALTFTIAGTDPPPAAPDPFLIAEANSTHVSLVWNIVDEPDVVGYRVYRGAVSGGPYPTMLTPQPIADNFFDDTQVAPGLDYFYVVTAVDACGEEGPFSVEAHARPRDITTPTVITSPPEGFETTDPFLTVSGTAEPGATVQVFSTDPATGKITPLGDVTADADGTFSVTVMLTAAGPQTITALAMDAFGNLGSSSVGIGILASIFVPPISPEALCVTVAPPCARTPEVGQTPTEITFTYHMTAPPGLAMIYVVALSSPSDSLVTTFLVNPGGSIVWSRSVPALPEAARLHPSAWCLGFPIFRMNESFALRDAVFPHTIQIDQQFEPHQTERDLITSYEENLIVAIEDGDESSVLSWLSIIFDEEDIDDAILGVVEEHNAAISTLFGSPGPHADAAVIELNLLLFRVNDELGTLEADPFVRVPDSSEEGPSGAAWINDDDDDLSQSPDTGPVGVPGEDDLPQLWWFFARPLVIPAVLGNAKLTLSDASPSSHVSFWRDSVKSADEVLPHPFDNLYLRTRLYIEGTSPSGQDLDQEFQATFGDGGGCLDRVKSTVVAIESVDYEPLPGDPGGAGNFQVATDHSFGIITDPPHGVIEGGERRFFPGKNFPSDSSHDTVAVRVRITPARADQKVWIKSFDVDDPSTTSGPVDDDVTGPLEDNRVPFEGPGVSRLGRPARMTFILADDLGRIDDATDAGGEVLFRFGVSGCRQPGNNFRKVAGFTRRAVTSTLLAAEGDPEAKVYRNGAGDSFLTVLPEISAGVPTQIMQSPLLTLWRHLHMEVDRMTDAVGNFAKADFVAADATGTTFTLGNIQGGLDHFPIGNTLDVTAGTRGRFQGGSLVGQDVGIVSNTETAITLDAPHPELMGLNLTTRDDDTLLEIPPINTDLLQSSDSLSLNRLAAAYIVPVYDGAGDPGNANNGTLVPFKMNTDGASFAAELEPWRESEQHNDPAHWVAYLQSGFQPERPRDLDSDDELTSSAGGYTLAINTGAPGTIIFQEVIADFLRVMAETEPASSFEALTSHVSVHEVGHHFAGKDTDGGFMVTMQELMHSIVAGTAVYFDARTLVRMRSVPRPENPVE
ncbi:MAG: hypothetical protein HYY93_12530 [Planctomycetes bacterium]|nr:hypothetical protein [Planctomycetota bacterium]